MDLPDIDFGEIEKMVSSLSEQDIDMLSGMAQQFFSPKGSGDENTDKSKRQNTENTGGFSIDPEMMKKIMSLMSKLNSHPDDSRCSFLMSLKPMLSPSRQQKVETAISFLRIMSILPLLNELEL